MQAQLCCALTGPGNAGAAAVPAHFAYVARYEYSDAVVQSDNFLRLSPCSDPYQTPLHCVVTTRPAGRQVAFPDRQGNTVHRVRIDTPHRELIVAAAGRVGLAAAGITPPPDVPLSALAYAPECRQFLLASPLVDPDHAGILTAAREAAAGATTLLETARRVVRWIHDHIRYQRGATSVRTTAADVLAAMRGVCQDQTHLGLAMLRALGIPARYVSGLLTAQAGETHAWLEFRHPQLGWLPADPTRGALIDNPSDYIKFAVGRDYSEAQPVSGSFVSRGSGRLDFAKAEVFFDRDAVSVADALALLPSTPG